MPAPFIVTGLPRSRTAWLAEFLGVPHEPSLRMDSLSDLKGILEGKGASDCMMAWLWRDILEINPETRFVVVLRPISEVRASLEKLGVRFPDWFLPKMADVLGEISAHPNTLALWFDELRLEPAIRCVWRHCYPDDVPFDRERWERMKDQNIQSDIKATLRLLVERDEILGRIFAPSYGHAA